MNICHNSQLMCWKIFIIKKNKNKKRIKKNSSKLVENIIPSIMRGNSNDHENI